MVAVLIILNILLDRCTKEVEKRPKQETPSRTKNDFCNLLHFTTNRDIQVIFDRTPTIDHITPTQ